MADNNIRLITFDLDDTLWNGTDVILQAEQAMQDWLSEYAPAVLSCYSRDELRALKFAFARENPQILHKVSAVRRLFLQHVFTQLNYPNAAHMAEECFQAFYAARQRVVLFPGVEKLLADLSRRYRLAAITNGNADLSRIGLADYFEFSLSAEDYAAPKPAPDLFLAAIQRSQLRPAQILHVGDHPEHDIRGAQKLGFKTCWLNDGRRPMAADINPDFEIQQIAHLAQLSL
jgi:FMN hydrolase / 5-amino-6-(5-phospho-D-ribitylamino)uracil phosphatase